MDTNDTRARLLEAVASERTRQDELWGTDFEGRDPGIWLAILMEEVGEAVEDIERPLRLEQELIQVAAVALSWAEHQLRQRPYTDHPQLMTRVRNTGRRARAIVEGSGNG